LHVVNHKFKLGTERVQACTR